MSTGFNMFSHALLNIIIMITQPTKQSEVCITRARCWDNRCSIWLARQWSERWDIWNTIKQLSKTVQRRGGSLWLASVWSMPPQLWRWWVERENVKNPVSLGLLMHLRYPVPTNLRRCLSSVIFELNIRHRFILESWVVQLIDLTPEIVETIYFLWYEGSLESPCTTRTHPVFPIAYTETSSSHQVRRRSALPPPPDEIDEGNLETVVTAGCNLPGSDLALPEHPNAGRQSWF